MKKITKDALCTIEKQLFNRALDLDVALYGVLFSNLPPEILVDAISMYQNKDGGFGNNLLLDNYNPASSPVGTVEALKILANVKLNDETQYSVLKDMLKKAFNYLYNKCLLIDNKWLFALKENNDFATANSYKYDDNKELDFNPTAYVLAYTFYFNDISNVYSKKALEMLEPVIEKFLIKDVLTKEEVMGFKELVKVLVDKNIKINKIDELVMKLDDSALCMVAKEKHLFSNVNAVLPLELFETYTNNNQINMLIDDNLDFLVETIKPHGLWEKNLNWQTDYPEQESAALKWIGRVSVQNLILLKKFERIEE